MEMEEKYHHKAKKNLRTELFEDTKVCSYVC